MTETQSPDQRDHRFPQFLPDGRHFLYYARGTPEGRGVYVSNLDGTDTQRLVDADAAAVYASSGHLLFVREGTLYAQSFDINQLALTGSPFPVADEALTNSGLSYAPLSASSSGSFVYRTGTNRQTQLIWFERDGTALERVGEPDSSPLLNISLSPDGRSVAMGRNIDGNWDIWLLDTQRGGLDRITSDPAIDLSPVWSPDGARVAFNSARPDNPGLYEKLASGLGGDELMMGSDAAKGLSDWSRDGRFVLYHSLSPTTGADLWALPLDGEREPFPIVQTDYDEGLGQFSPDGRWIAYQSNESGRVEVYLRPFPGPGRQWRISTAGGSQARWSLDGNELFYITPDRSLMSVPIGVNDGQSVDIGAPALLFDTGISSLSNTFGVTRYAYAVSPDGKRFLIHTVVGDATSSPITVILNWNPENAQ